MDYLFFQGEEYIYKEDWGEQLVGKYQPVIGICDIKLETLQVLQGVPPNFSPGQVIWAKNGEGVYGIALDNEPRKLGLIYCTNRKGYVFHLSLKGEFSKFYGCNHEDKLKIWILVCMCVYIYDRFQIFYQKKINLFDLRD